MAANPDASAVLRTLWDRIDAQDWEGMAALLDPQLQARYVDTGETFNAGELVRLNREYPGRWHTTVEEIVGDGERAVSRTRVSDGRVTHYAASFATVTDGLITSLVEVWVQAGAPVPVHLRP
jgi:uncharacterized protein (DUF2267 family)